MQQVTAFLWGGTRTLIRKGWESGIGRDNEHQRTRSGAWREWLASHESCGAGEWQEWRGRGSLGLLHYPKSNGDSRTVLKELDDQDNHVVAMWTRNLLAKGWDLEVRVEKDRWCGQGRGTLGLRWGREGRKEAGCKLTCGGKLQVTSCSRQMAYGSR